MSFSVAIATILLASSSANTNFCRDVENRIEPDMRILESDLAQAAAVQAAEELRGMIERGDLTGEFQFGALNQSKIVYGHILLRQAEADRGRFGPDSVESNESVRTLCAWLSREGYWYD